MRNNVTNNQENILGFLRAEQPSNIGDQLVQKLRYLIVSGELPNGYVFPNENKLCQQLSVGRSTLREAYKVLEANGLISRSKRGTVVKDFSSSEPEVFSKKEPTKEYYQELMEFRCMLEGENAYYCALRAADQEIESLSQILNKMRFSKDNIVELSRYDLLFHLDIAKYAHNRFLLQTFSLVTDVFSKSIHQSFRHDPKMPDTAIRFHDSILNCMFAREADKAKKIMIEHLSSVQANLADYYQ